MMMITNKKGLSPIGLLGEILIVLAVIIILLLIVLVPRLQTQGDIVGVQISGIQGDADKDSIRNFFDKCPCTFGDSLNDGCPATFTDAQKEEDVKKYNSEPVCGIVIDQTTGQVSQPNTQSGQKTAEEKAAEQKTEQKSEPAAFKRYQSIEIFGDDDWGANPQNAEINSVCTGWIGSNCPAAEKSCDAKEYSREDLKEKCWIMASEDDAFNQCGQAKADHGTVISSKEYKDLGIDNYLSADNDGDPQNLFSWKWKSQSKFGSLVCNKGFWYSCKEQNEGRTLDVAGKTYTCKGSEWG